MASMKKSPDRKTSVGDAISRFAAAIFLGLAAALLSSCESTRGKYGPGAGFFDNVVVDAGHGGGDRGAKSCRGVPEKALTLDTAQRLAGVLRANGLQVVETRKGDHAVPLCNRTAISNRSGQAVFVSVHFNWVKRSGPHGIEIYYNNIRSVRLAANILKETLGAYHTSNRGIKKRGLYVLRNNRRPAVLCELGFISSPGENRCVQSPAVRQHLAELVAAGILAERAGRIP
jgi:N-acetylmuramoyl-L-alanine amidase